MVNADIQQEIKESGIRKWEIANEIGIADTTFSKYLRKEQSQEFKQSVRDAILKLSTERE